jgi:hypothetical protein
MARRHRFQRVSSGYPNEVATVPTVVKLTKNAPIKTPGQTLYPNISKAAIAIPVHGHTAVALACTYASSKPSFPAAKYTAASPATVATFLCTSDRVIPSSPPRPRPSGGGNQALRVYTPTVPFWADLSTRNASLSFVIFHFTKAFTLTGT